MQIIACSGAPLSLVPEAKRLRPDLIIANATLLGAKARNVLAGIKRASPNSKLIVADFDAGWEELESQSGVDLYLEEEALVKRLLGAARQLASQCEPVRNSGGRVPPSRRIARSRPV